MFYCIPPRPARLPPPVHGADVEVLTKIYMALGTPTDDSWAGLRNMPAFMEFQPTPAPGLRKLFPASLVGVGGACRCQEHWLACGCLLPCWKLNMKQFALFTFTARLPRASCHCAHACDRLPLALLTTPLAQASDDALDLLARMMSLDASRRISAADALQHRYFRSDPPPSSLDQLPKPRLRQQQRIDQIVLDRHALARQRDRRPSAKQARLIKEAA